MMLVEGSAHVLADLIDSGPQGGIIDSAGRPESMSAPKNVITASSFREQEVTEERARLTVLPMPPREKVSAYSCTEADQEV